MQFKPSSSRLKDLCDDATVMLHPAMALRSVQSSSTPSASLRRQLLVKIFSLGGVAVSLNLIVMALLGPMWQRGGLVVARNMQIGLLLLTASMSIVTGLWLLRGLVFRRVEQLRAFVEQVEAAPDTPARLRLGGQNDELESAASGLNRLLDRLNHDRELQRAQSDVLRLIAENGELKAVLKVIRDLLERRYPGAALDWLPTTATQPEAPSSPNTWTVGVRGRAGERYGHLLLSFPQGLPDDITAEAAWMADLLGVAAEQERLRRNLSQHAYHDDLTGQLNRRGLHRALSRQLESGPHKNAPLAVFHLDIDRFKHANDLLGHAAGDDLLREVAQRLAGLPHAPGQDIQVARLGADEFLLSVQPFSDLGQIRQYAEQLSMLVSQPLNLHGHSYQPSVSVGYSVAPHDTDDADTLLRFAALTTEHVKRSGPGQTSGFTPALQHALVDRLQLEHDLREAIAADALTLAYQPLVALQQDCIVGCEALLRWNHPTRGPVSPAHFVPIAEEAGLIVELGYWVLRSAAAQAAQWQAQGIFLPVSVNISAAQLLHPDIVASVQNLLQEFGLSAQCLTLEVTESLLMHGTPGSEAHERLRRLAELGLNIAVDDFGTGYSSLSYLHKLPIQTVKVDRSFVKDLPESSEATRIVETIIQLGLQLNLNVVAEGVERPEQAALLTSLGCTGAQGFLYARPMPPEQLPSFLKAHGIVLATGS